MPVMEFPAVDYIYPEPLNTKNDNSTIIQAFRV